MFKKIKSVLKVYVWGFWFLLTRPITFRKFFEVYLDHKNDLDHIDAARELGFYEMNRKQRRKIVRGK